MFQKFVSKVSAIGSDPNDNEDTRLQKTLLVFSSLMMASLAIVWSSIYLAFRENLAASIPFTYAILSFLSIGWFARTRQYAFFRGSQLLFPLLLPFFLMLALGGFVSSSAVVLWSFTSPLGALLFAGRRQVTGWFIAYLALVIIGAFLEPFGHPASNLPPAIQTAFFVMNIGCVTIVTFVLLQYFMNQKDTTLRLLRREQDKSENLLLNILPKAVEEQALTQKQMPKSVEAVTSFGKYTGLELIARGGMGEIYRAQHPTLGCPVAIKILPKYLAENEAAYRRYDHEAQAIAQLKHPNIVGMYEYGTMDGMPYIVLEYIDGQSLSEILKQRGLLSLTEALPLFKEIASALDYSHAVGVVHRDIKPSNVMIERGNQKSPRVVLMDFGIAKLSSSMTQLTGTGILIGTLDYVSPEQIQGSGEVDAQTDIYSFGVLVYQVLTGALPFEHKNVSALLMAHLMQPVSDPRERMPDLPEVTAKAMMKAMSKEP